MDLHVIQQFIKKVQELDTLFQEMQTLKQQEVGLKLLTSLLKRNETRLGGRFKMKTVIWYSMKDFEKFFDICADIVVLSNKDNAQIKDEFDDCLSQYSISDYDIVTNMEQIVIKLAHQLDAIETTLDYNEENSILVSENDSNDYVMGIDMNTELDETIKYELEGGTGTQSDFVTGIGTGTQSDFVTEDGTGAQSEFLTEDVMGTQSDFVTEDGTGTQSDFVTEDGTGMQSDFVTEDGTGTQSDFVTEDGTGTQSEFVTEDRTGTQSEFVTEDGTGTQSKFVTEVVMGTQSDFVAEDGTGKQSEFVTNDGTGTQSGFVTWSEDSNFEPQYKNRKYQLPQSETSKDRFSTNQAQDLTSYSTEMNIHTERAEFKNENHECEDSANDGSKNDPETDLDEEENDDSESVDSDASVIDTSDSNQNISNFTTLKEVNQKLQSADINIGHIKSTNLPPSGYDTDMKCNVKNIKKEYNSIDDNDANEKEDTNTVKQKSRTRSNSPVIDKRSRSPMTDKRSRSGSRSYKCSECDKSFCRENLLYKHYRKHGGGKFCCLVCGMVPNSQRQLNKHMVKHEQESKHICKTCGKIFTEKKLYLLHVAEHNSHLCSLCDKSFPTQPSLGRHRRLVHRVKDTWDSKVKVRRDDVAAQMKYQCDICKVRFTKEVTLIRHKVKHTGEIPYRCDVCSMSFKTQQCYLKHTQTIRHNQKIGKTDGDRRFLCQQCGKAYLRKDTLRRHERHHTGEKPHMCQFCGFKCKETSNLKRHIELHFNSQRSFICEICGAAFHTKKTMEVHIMFKHSEERKYTCSHCDMTFKANSSLIRHMKVHSEEKEHLCWCGTAYKSMYNLRRHVNKIHGGEGNLPPAKHVQILDCPPKITVPKPDFHSTYEDQSLLHMGDNFDQDQTMLQRADNHDQTMLQGGRDDFDQAEAGESLHNISFGGEGDGEQLQDTTAVSAIPTIETFRHHKPLQQDNYSLSNIPQYTDCDGKEVNIHETVSIHIHESVNINTHESVNINVHESVNINTHEQSSTHEPGDIGTHEPVSLANQLRDESSDTCVYDNTNLLTNQTTADVKTNLPQFSLYGYPPPYHNGLPQFMYMPPRYEPPLPTPASFPSYEQLIKFGPIFPTATLPPPPPPGLNPSLNVPVARVIETDYCAAGSSLSQDQLRLLHHEIYSRLSQEEISQRLNSDTYRHSLSHIDIVNTEQKPESMQSTSMEFDYTEKSDCSYNDQSNVDKLTVSGTEDKETGATVHENVYESSIDADYLQSRREMAAESLALMSALTPESVYNGQELNNQML